MKRQKNPPANKKQLALDLGERSGSPRKTGNKLEVKSDGDNIICFSAALKQQEQASHGAYYAHIASMAKHLD